MKVVCLVLLAAFACGKRNPIEPAPAEAAPAKAAESPAPKSPEPPPPSPPPTENKPAEAAPAKVATAWIAALRQRDVDALTRATRFPFLLRDTGTEGKCKNATVADAAQLPGALACLLQDDLLNEDLKANPAPEADPVSKRTLPKWARKWSTEVRAGTTPVSVFIHGNGNAFDLVLLVAGDGVAGLFKHATFEKN